MRIKKDKGTGQLYPGADLIIAVDPGLDGTGWALWESREGEPDRHIPMLCGTLRAPRQGSMSQRCQALWERLHDAICEYDRLQKVWRRDSTYVFLEMPQHFASSARGIAAQAGAVYALTFLVGFLAAKFQPCSVIVFTPNEWKGQLSKDVVARRVEKRLGTAYEGLGVKTHAIDAVGIGLFAIGRF